MCDHKIIKTDVMSALSLNLKPDSSTAAKFLLVPSSHLELLCTQTDDHVIYNEADLVL